MPYFKFHFSEAKPFHSNMDDFKSSNHYNNDLEIVESEKYLPTGKQVFLVRTTPSKI